MSDDIAIAIATPTSSQLDSIPDPLISRDSKDPEEHESGESSLDDSSSELDLGEIDSQSGGSNGETDSELEGDDEEETTRADLVQKIKEAKVATHALGPSDSIPSAGPSLDRPDKDQLSLADLQTILELQEEALKTARDAANQSTGESSELTSQGDAGSAAESAEDGDESDDDNLRKLEDEVNSETLLKYHPELKQNNSSEIQALSTVVRDKKGRIIDRLHRTNPFMTKYEKARIIGQRTKQLNYGAQPFVKVPSDMLNGYSIALEELKQKRIPFIIRRPLPSGASEYWKVEDLEIIDY